MIMQGMTPFLEACEALGPLQFGIALPQSRERLSQVWHRPFVILGRDPQADIVVNDPNVSRRHAYLQMIGGRAFCLDLGSRTGLNWGTEVNTQAWLDPDRILRLGDSRIRIAAGCRVEPGGSRDDSPLISHPDESLELPYVTLEFTNGDTNQANWPMYCMLAIIGRAPGCKVRLQSPTVSRFHCSLVRTPYGVWVIDLQGREGVRVNGQRVRYAKLEDNDDVQLGRFKIRMHCGPAPRTWNGTAEETAVKQPHPAGTLIVRPSPADIPTASMPIPRTPALTQAGVEAVQSIVAPLMNEFASMQQNLFDQFQQSMVMMVQMFRNVNQEQMKEVRQELEEIKGLTKEMKDLQAELNSKPAAALTTPQADPAVRFSPLPTAEDQQLDLLLSALTMTTPGQLASMPVFEPILPEAHANPDAPLISDIPVRPEIAQPARIDPAPVTAPPAASGFSNGTSPHEARPTVPNPPLPLPKAPLNPATGADLHGWLTDRLATIQNERQTRMQKLFAMLTGKRSGSGDMP